MSSATYYLSRQEGDACLRHLEHQLDGAVFRSVTRAGKAWRSRRPKFAGRPEHLSFPRLLASGYLSPAHLAAALSRALRAGALESARELAQRLEPLLEGLPASAAAAAAEDAIEAYWACGGREHCQRLAMTSLGTLRCSGRGSSLLHLLGLEEGDTRLPDGGVNLLGLSRGIAAGKIDAASVARSVGLDAWPWMRNPELMLLVWSALRLEDPTRALTWLNRFLRAHGVAPYRWSSEPKVVDNPLALLEPYERDRLRDGPLVSVLVAVRNGAHSLSYALRSLLEQTHERLEVLVCDDASDDRTLSLMKEIAARDERVRLFRSATNQGPYNVRNALARRARGDFLTCHDADDLAIPSRIAMQVSLLQKTRSSVCVGSWLRMDAFGRVVFFKNQRAIRMALVTAMFTREAFHRVGPFRSARVGADWELFTDFCASSARAVVRLRTPLVLASWQATSATREHGMEALEDGYRSPLRRAYGELVCAKHADGPKPTDTEIDDRLRAIGNYAAPSDVTEIS